MAVHFHNVTIIGVGLIGGSLALVMKEKGLAGLITGGGRSQQTLEQAIALGVIDRAGKSAGQSVEDADLVVLASPVGMFEAIVREIAPHLKKGAVLTDVGSVKGELVRKIEQLLPAGVHFVPAHPIAGKEKHGVSEAVATLFLGAKCILTPTSQTDATTLAMITELWTQVGAKVMIMDADMHDKVFAAVSHLPHVAAYAMMSAVADLNTGTEDYLAFSGGGFRDFTRIAASSPEMWRDICVMNREQIVLMIERYQYSLNKIKKAIQYGDGERIEKQFRAASDVRRGLG